MGTGQGPFSPYATGDKFEVVMDYSVYMWGKMSIEETEELTSAHVNLIQAAANPESVD